MKFNEYIKMKNFSQQNFGGLASAVKAVKSVPKKFKIFKENYKTASKLNKQAKEALDKSNAALSESAMHSDQYIKLHNTNNNSKLVKSLVNNPEAVAIMDKARKARKIYETELANARNLQDQATAVGGRFFRFINPTRSFSQPQNFDAKTEILKEYLRNNKGKILGVVGTKLHDLALSPFRNKQLEGINGGFQKIGSIFTEGRGILGSTRAKQQASLGKKIVGGTLAANALASGGVGALAGLTVYALVGSGKVNPIKYYVFDPDSATVLGEFDTKDKALTFRNENYPGARINLGNTLIQKVG